jgi:predicted TIM-barrel fold metal-dependent hydrolase
MTAADRSAPTYLAEHRRRKSSASQAIKQRLSHPVIDTDLHTLEFAPLLEDHIHAVGGSKAVDGFRKIVSGGHGVRGFGAADWYGQTPEERRDRRSVRPPWWSLPTKNTLDFATFALPELLHERLEESGSDFAVLYPNAATLALAVGDPDLRRAVARAMNNYNAEVYAPYADRVTPVAAIPLHTPEEGIEELEYAVNTLKLKAFIIPGYIRRPIGELAAKYPAAEHPLVARHGFWLDTFGLDSLHDYDPFWAKAVELKAPLTTHASGQGWTARATPSNFMYNHIGHFADAAHAFAKSLFFGGVTRRFPELRFGFLEGGANWAASLLTDIVGHWEKRNKRDIVNYDPSNIDRDLLVRLFREHGGDLLRGGDFTDQQIIDIALSGPTGIMLHPQQNLPPDEFAAAGIETLQDILDRFIPNFFFGAEADDATVAHAFNTKVNPGGARLNAFWASDAGHWDVPDLTGVLAETWALVERGALTEQDFEDLVFNNPYRFYTEANPDFFKGTAVEAKLARRQAA